MSEYQGNFSSHLQPKQFDINSVDVTTKAYNSLNDMTTSTMMQTAVWINQSIIMIMHHLRYPKKKNVIYVRIVQAVLDLIRIFSVLDSRNKSNFLLQWLSFFFFLSFLSYRFCLAWDVHACLKSNQHFLRFAFLEKIHFSSLVIIYFGDRFALRWNVERYRLYDHFLLFSFSFSFGFWIRRINPSTVNDCLFFSSDSLTWIGWRLFCINPCVVFWFFSFYIFGINPFFIANESFFFPTQENQSNFIKQKQFYLGYELKVIVYLNTFFSHVLECRDKYIFRRQQLSFPVIFLKFRVLKTVLHLIIIFVLNFQNKHIFHC